MRENLSGSTLESLFNKWLANKTHYQIQILYCYQGVWQRSTSWYKHMILDALNKSYLQSDKRRNVVLKWLKSNKYLTIMHEQKLRTFSNTYRNFIRFKILRNTHSKVKLLKKTNVSQSLVIHVMLRYSFKYNRIIILDKYTQKYPQTL